MNKAMDIAKSSHSGLAKNDTDAMERIRLSIDGMTCAGCAANVSSALKAIEGVQNAVVNLTSEQAIVDFQTGNDMTVLQAAVSAAGYKATPFQPDASVNSNKFGPRRLGLLVAGSGILTLPLVGQMVAGWIGLNYNLEPWLQFLFATPVQFIFGWRFYKSAYRALRLLSGNMDQLVVLGTTAAYGYSLYHWYAGFPGYLYLEGAATIITLVLFGKWLEGQAKDKAAAAIWSLMAQQPDHAHLLRNGEEIEVPVNDVKVGDILRVRPGQRIAVDGFITEGRGGVDESMLTGEARAINKGTGASLIGGSINLDSVLTYQASAVGFETVLSRIIRLVEGAQASKAPIERWVDKIATIFVPIVITISAVTYLIWWLGVGNLDVAFTAAITVLIIACPCALGLATPAAVTVGTGIAARHGILIRDIEALERARDIDLVLLDKTGTLTTGNPQIRFVAPCNKVKREALISISASILTNSTHPMARAVCGLAADAGILNVNCKDFIDYPGKGVEAVIGESRLIAGSSEFLSNFDLASEIPNNKSWMGLSLVHVAEVEPSRKYLGTFGVSDSLRPGAIETVARLQVKGIKTVILSGDTEAASRAIADECGISKVISEVQPDGKVSEVIRLRNEDHVVAMVGDGINDAPALAAADIAVAMGGGSDVAMEAAGITLMRDDPRLIADSIEISRSVGRCIRQNLFWAFVYNIVTLPVAALGLLNPVIAGGVMALSSVSVIFNALLLRRWKPEQNLDGNDSV